MANPVIDDADLEVSGLESAQSPLPPINIQWHIAIKDWRGSAEPNLTAQLYLDSRKRDFGLDSIVASSTIVDRLGTEYGSYQLASRAIQEHMMRQKYNLCLNASKVAFDNPELTQRLIGIRTIGAISLFRGPTPQGLRRRGFPYDQSETEYILGKLRKDSGDGRLIIDSTRTITGTGKIICFPTTTVRGGFPDRRWPEERRPIRDGRFPKSSHAKVRLSTCSPDYK